MAAEGREQRLPNWGFLLDEVVGAASIGGEFVQSTAAAAMAYGGRRPTPDRGARDAAAGLGRGLAGAGPAQFGGGKF